MYALKYKINDGEYQVIHSSYLPKNAEANTCLAYILNAIGLTTDGNDAVSPFFVLQGDLDGAKLTAIKGIQSNTLSSTQKRNLGERLLNGENTITFEKMTQTELTDVKANTDLFTWLKQCVGSTTPPEGYDLPIVTETTIKCFGLAIIKPITNPVVTIHFTLNGSNYDEQGNYSTYAVAQAYFAEGYEYLKVNGVDLLSTGFGYGISGVEIIADSGGDVSFATREATPINVEAKFNQAISQYEMQLVGGNATIREDKSVVFTLLAS
nr:hypothetical protein [uncultured Moraxella sp.]